MPNDSNGGVQLLQPQRDWGGYQTHTMPPRSRGSGESLHHDLRIISLYLEVDSVHSDTLHLHHEQSDHKEVVLAGQPSLPLDTGD